MTRKVAKYGKLQVDKKKFASNSIFIFQWKLVTFDKKFNIFSGQVGKTPFKAISIILLFNQKSFNILLIGGADGIFWKWP